MLNKHVELGIALLPPIEIQEEAKLLNRMIAKQLPEVKNMDNIFHLSLYQGNFNYSELDRLKQALENLLTGIKSSFEITLEASLHDMGVNIFWNAKKNPALQGLHEKVVTTFSQYRAGMPEQFKRLYEQLPTDKKHQTDLYGIPNMMENFNPHITVFYRSDNHLKMAGALKSIVPNEKHLNFIADRLIIGQLGYDGNVKKIIHQSSMQIKKS